MTFTTEEAKATGEQIGINWDEVEFDADALAAGMEVELEHGSKVGDEFNITEDDPKTTAIIAWVHLTESPLYYELLAKMEEDMQADTKEAGFVRQAYQRTKQGPWKKQKLSPELQNYASQYIKQIAAAIQQGVSADDAFKKLQPDLDALSSSGLVDLLYENLHVGSRPLADLKDVLQYGDVFDGVQTLLERTIWEAAVLWWGEQATEKADKDIKPDAPKVEPDEQGTKIVGPKSKKPADTGVQPTASVLTFAGYRYVG